MRKKKMIVIIISTVLITALVLMIAFWLWLELSMPGRIVLPRSPFYHVALPGKPTASARLYWLGSPRLGSDKHLLVVKSKSLKRPEAYHIDFSKREIGIPDFPVSEYVPLFSSAVVNIISLERFPLAAELDAQWNENDREVRIRIIGYSDAAKKTEPLSPEKEEEVARAMMPIAYQREIIFTSKASKR